MSLLRLGSKHHFTLMLIIAEAFTPFIKELKSPPMVNTKSVNTNDDEEAVKPTPASLPTRIEFDEAVDPLPLSASIISDIHGYPFLSFEHLQSEKQHWLDQWVHY